MKRKILALLRAFFVIPFMAGTRRNSSGSFRFYDCSTSSIIMFLLLLASIIVFTGSLSIESGAMQRVQVIKVFLILTDTTGIVMCALIGHLIYKNGVPSTESSGSQSIKPKYIQLGFVWLFAILSSVFFCFKAAVEMQCWNSFSPTQIADSILRVILILSQSAVLRYLQSYKIEGISLTKYAIRVLIGVNVCLWVNTFIRDKTLLNKNTPTDHQHNISDWIECALNSTSGLLYYKSKKFLLPACVEFMLLCITLLTEISSLPSSDNETIEEMDEKHSDENSLNIGYEENTPLLPTVAQNNRHVVRSSIY
ncbi:uncharacterized protein LOC110444736, partial [Mizuhopecten yessoensis]|uniref:uncharacterized protein LOC110444736 n=1 Tax=Mizuhopecten yessoensis TaxID=6573 RepID=UPI000B45CDE9